MSQHESYFLQQTFPHLSEGEAVEAAGYFRTAMRRHAGTIGAYVAAAQMRAYFVALTPRRLIAVMTRAPATSKPLLENERVVVIDRAEIRTVSLTPRALLIDAGDRSLALAMATDNKYFPRQGKLLEMLSKAHGDGEPLESLRRRRRRSMLLRAALVLPILIAASFVYGWLSR